MTEGKIVKGLLNGAPIPNWVKLLVLGGVLGFQAAIVWSGQQSAVRELGRHLDVVVNTMQQKSEADSLKFRYLELLINSRTSVITTKIDGVQDDISSINRR